MDDVTQAIEVRRENPLGDRMQLTKTVLEAERQQRAMVGQYVNQCMVEGTDYGTIPGTPKPTLLKPGAEKLVDLFRCTPRFRLMTEVEDFANGFFNYKFRVRLVQRDSGAVLAEGYGSANSREARYRWRDGKRKCPECGSEALLKSKDKPEWFCWAKRGGCGKVYPDKDPRILNQQVGRVENPDIADLANTILKMAKKRALVDGAIALARCSDMFTQDVEDFEHTEAAPPPPPQSAEQKKGTRKRAPADPPAEPLPEATKAQLEELRSRFPTPESARTVREEPPPPTDADMPPLTDEFEVAAAAVHPAPPPLEVIPLGLGKHAGKRISELSPAQLADFWKGVAEWLAKHGEKHRMHKEGLAAFSAANAELIRRAPAAEHSWVSARMDEANMWLASFSDRPAVVVALMEMAVDALATEMEKRNKEAKP